MNNSDNYLNSSINDENNASDRSFQTYSRPVNRFFPDGVVDILNKWFYENQNYPYPDENMTNFLAKEANISPKQVRKWFANKRVRSNKCYKQTFRIRRVDSTLQQSSRHINRRQTKSVSDSESLQLQQSCFYSNVIDDDQSVSPDRKSYTWQDQHTNSSPSSSTSSSPTSFASSSPISKNNDNNNPFFSTNQFEHTNNVHQPDSLNRSRSMNGFNSLYNPYFLMNFLQNPSMALQAVLANRLITRNNNCINDQMSDVCNSISMQSPAKVNRRKPHLLNIFLNDSYKASNLHLIEEVTPSMGEESQILIKSEEAKSCFKDLSMDSKRMANSNSTCSNIKPMRSSFSLEELSSSFNSASVQYNESKFYENATNVQLIPPKSEKKIK